MSQSVETGNLPEGLITADPEKLQNKVARLRKAGAAAIHVVFDFDLTLTMRNAETNVDVTTWQILREHLPSEGQAVYQELYDKYRRLEMDGTMTEADAADWWSSILDLFVEYKLNLPTVERDLLERSNIRPGTKELFEFCRENGIPTVVLSAGIRDVIEMYCRTYDIPPSLVLSTALDLDENGNIIGWNRDSLVHALNKSEADHPELSSIREDRPYVILAGDSMNDHDMANGEENVLRVRILNQHLGEAVNRTDEHERTFKKFDAAIESGSLIPLLNLMEFITSKR